MRSVNPTMQDVRESAVLLLIGLVAIWAGLAFSFPPWLMVMLSWSHGGMAVIILADYRDILRQRKGLLIQDGGGS